jgi:hypothetical protein
MTARVDPAAALLAAAALLWLGLLLGVSFLATPAKFLAPSLSLPVALEVGRHTFAVFSYVEIAAALTVLALALASGLGRLVAAAAAITGAMVALQALWLLPVLDARVETILRGGMPEPAILHEVYVGVEVLKALLLVFLAWRALTMHVHIPAETYAEHAQQPGRHTA